MKYDFFLATVADTITACPNKIDTRMARGASPAEGSLFVVSDHQWIDRVLSKFVFRAGTKIPLDCKISKLDGNGGT